jgi:hypothetical protein
MEPVIFSELPSYFSFAAAVIFLQIGILLFLTGKRHLRLISVETVALFGAIAWASVPLGLPSLTLPLIIAGGVGGGALGYFLRPVGLGLVLACIGGVVATQLINTPFVPYVVAVDMFAYGLFLTDLVPTVVASLLASSILLVSILWIGVPGPAAFVLACAGGSARQMASSLPPWFAMRWHSSALSKPV